MSLCLDSNNGTSGSDEKEEKSWVSSVPNVREFSATKWGRNGLSEVRSHRFSASVIYEFLRNAQILLQYSCMNMDQGPL